VSIVRVCVSSRLRKPRSLHRAPLLLADNPSFIRTPILASARKVGIVRFILGAKTNGNKQYFP
jgi:hypothetical protein